MSWRKFNFFWWSLQSIHFSVQDTRSGFYPGGSGGPALVPGANQGIIKFENLTLAIQISKYLSLEFKT